MGPIIRDWNEKRVIRPRVKAVATITTILMIGLVLVFGTFNPAMKAISGMIGITVIVMIYRQPS
jgi:uncharacterized membrane protein YbaN (DUF454 family)